MDQWRYSVVTGFKQIRHFICILFGLIKSINFVYCFFYILHTYMYYPVCICKYTSLMSEIIDYFIIWNEMPLSHCCLGLLFRRHVCTLFSKKNKQLGGLFEFLHRRELGPRTVRDLAILEDNKIPRKHSQKKCVRKF